MGWGAESVGVMIVGAGLGEGVMRDEVEGISAMAGI